VSSSVPFRPGSSFVGLPCGNAGSADELGLGGGDGRPLICDCLCFIYQRQIRRFQGHEGEFSCCRKTPSTLHRHGRCERSRLVGILLFREIGPPT
jgi:hypothetical protein